MNVPKSDAKVANLVIRMHLLGKKCKVNQLVIPLELNAMQGMRKHAALRCIMPSSAM